MKRILAATAGIALALSARAEIPSANVVGYQTIDAASGFTSVVPTFEAIGGGSIKVSDLKGSFEELDSIQLVDETGDIPFQYFYMGEDIGWVTDDFETPANDVELPVGVAFLVTLENEGDVTFAGQVKSGTVPVTSVAGFTFTGNFFPQDVKLSAITFEGIEELDSLQFLDASGDTEAQWFYMGEDTGWVADDFETDVNNETIAAGSAFLLTTENAGVVMTLPAVL